MQEKIRKTFATIGIILLAILFIFLGLNFLENYKKSSATGYSEGLKNPSFKLSVPTPSQFSAEESFSQPETEMTSRMIIKTGWLNLVVEDIPETMKAISKFAEDNDGWVVSRNFSEYGKLPSGSITVRVPAETFEEAIDYFRSLASRVTNENTQSQDITEEYIDLEARLENLEAAETQLLELMERTGKISEILEVQRELTNVRQQIEQIQGRMKYLEESVEMSLITVNLALSEELLPIPPAEKWRPKYVLLEAWKNVLNFWKEFSYFLIRTVVWAQVWLPFLIIIFIGFKLGIKIFRKKRTIQ